MPGVARSSAGARHGWGHVLESGGPYLPPRASRRTGSLSSWNSVSISWLNHLLVGTVLHHYHHSAAPVEAKNFGAVVSVWGQLFGTLVYRPAQVPRALGIDEPLHYPADTQLLSVLAFPLRRGWGSSGRPTKRSPR